MAYDAQRQVVRTLARAAREFDRARDALLRESAADTAWADADGPQPTTPEPTARPERGGSLSRVGRAAGEAARTVGVAARAAGRSVAGTHPRHTDWAHAALEDRISWWVQRFGTAAAALTAVPGLLGRLGRLSGVGDVIGGAAQVLIVNAVAREMGVTDIPQRVAVAAEIVLGRRIDPAEIRRALAEPAGEEAEGAASGQEPRLVRRLGRAARLLWRVARDLRRLDNDVDNRPGAGRLVGLARNLPVVGAASAFAYERVGIARAAEAARARFAATVTGAG